ncbi:MAG TPA: hypothetical protein VK213_01225 [Bacteroidales bacterium]|nr:hypothetical protein [Bacteroidales bacterium]
MKRTIIKSLIFLVLGLMLPLTGCFMDKLDDDIKFVFGEFPDTVRNITDLNSQYDDYNVGMLDGSGPIIFSTNWKSAGGQFDLEQGYISFTFDQKNGTFMFDAGISNNEHLDRLIRRAQTPYNDFGPYRFFNSQDGYEYLVLASANSNGSLDLKYLRNLPQYGNSIPDIEGPFPVNLINTSSNDAYLCLDANLDTAYYCSDRSGNFDIYLLKRSLDIGLADWLDNGFTEGVRIESINSSANDKCPLVYKNVLVFTSDRPGGLGGFDLYYSVFKNGNWSAPVNFGPGINTQYNEYRPFIGSHAEFSNQMLIFSSDRPGGKGRYDLYYTGFKVE